jgi:hypothetical protein
MNGMMSQELMKKKIKIVNRIVKMIGVMNNIKRKNK